MKQNEVFARLGVLGFLLVGLLAIGAQAREGRIELGPAYYEIGNSVETPHVKWGKPLAGGPLRALIIAPSSTQRETVELWQRIALNYTAIPIACDGKIGTPDTLEYPTSGTVAAVTARLRQAVQTNYDVIVTCLTWTNLPPDVAAALQAQVNGGAGLVLVNQPGQPATVTEPGFQAFTNTWKEIARPSWIAAGARLDTLPYYRKGTNDVIGPPEKVFACYAAGKGRVVHVKTGASGWTFFAPDIGDTPGASQWDFEDQEAFAAKLLLWAAGRVPEAYLTNLTCEATSNSSVITLSLAVKDPQLLAACHLLIRDRWGAVLAETNAPLAVQADTKSLAILLPTLKGGEHRAEVRLLNKQGEALWWGVWPVTVKPACGLASVTLVSDEVLPGQPVKAQITLAGQPLSQAKLNLTVIDAYGRIVNAIEGPARSGAVAVDVKHPLCLYHELAVTLVADGRVLDEKRARFAVPVKGPGWDDFSFLFWHHTTESWIGRLVSRELNRKYLADSLDCAAWQTPERVEEILWRVAEDGLWTVPYVNHVGNDYGGTGLMRAPCVSQPDTIKATRERMSDIGRRVRKFRPAAYTLGDENTLTSDETDVCFCPDCQASFRVYLQAVYPSLTALNAEWGTAFTTWTNVSPIIRQEAIAKGQVPRWVDHRMHMNSVFVNIHRVGRDGTRSGDPLARVGFDGPVGRAGYNGYDLWKFAQFMDFWGTYAYNWDWYAAPRSFCPKGYYGAVWFGGYPDTRYWFHTWPWNALLGGMSAIWWWPAYGCGSCDAIAPDFRPYPDFLAIVERDIRPLKSGIGKLIMHTAPAAAPIALYYSIESLYACLAYGTPPGAIGHAPSVLDAAGLTFDLVAPAQLPGGALSRYRVLMLQTSLALSDSEAAAIRSFVNAGGILVADVRPGVTDEHCKKRSAGALDDLFEFKVNASITSAQPEASPHRDGTKVGRGVPAEPGTASQSYDHTIFTVRDVGKGKTVLLSNGAATNANLGRALGALLRPMGIVPPVEIFDAKGKYVGAPTLYRDGGAMLVAFSGDAMKYTWGPVQVHLPEPAWCYLAGEGLCLGYTNQPIIAVSDTLRYRVLVGLPYEVTGLNVTHRTSSGRAHELRLKLATRGGKAGDHVVRLVVTGPDGSERSCYAANLTLAGGRGEHVIPLALNDPHGEWKATATDVATGARATVVWQD